MANQLSWLNKSLELEFPRRTTLHYCRGTSKLIRIKMAD
ncbi:hypothetical protein HDC91_002701 [Mucilaginibacter sp. AK015]|nr:hypothetical protein [Mucilaginibacter sp. AK015]